MRNLAFLFLSLLCLAGGSRLFAMGGAEETETEAKKENWYLCIAGFDTTSLSNNKLNIHDTIMKKLVDNLGSINYRSRVHPEFAYYKAAAWAKTRSTAAKALEAKQNERSLLLYSGEAGWRYRRNIQRIDVEIEKLRLALVEVENDIPFVESDPSFFLLSDNLEYKFPAPPKSGGEYVFCVDRKADALLTGSIVEFHERFIVSWKLYTIYSRSFVLEDSIIFSHNDLEESMGEITRKLIIALSGNEPALLTVKAEPEDSLVLLNMAFAGEGEISDLEYPPGPVTVTASAPGHESLTFDTELFPGESALIGINLWPIKYGDMEILSPGNIYLGSLFVGEGPLTLRLPVNQMEYIELLAPELNKSGKVVFQAPGIPGFIDTMNPRVRDIPKEGRIENSRRLYYWAWGGTWLAGIASWLSYYSSGFNNFTKGAFSALGVTAVFDIFLLGRYLYFANKDSTPATR